MFLAKFFCAFALGAAAFFGVAAEVKPARASERDVPVVPAAVLRAVAGCHGVVAVRGEESGSGCLVDEQARLVLTATHVVVGDDWRAAEDGKKIASQRFAVSFDVVSPAWERVSIPVEHVRYFAGDLALLRLAFVPSWMRAALTADPAAFEALVGKEIYAISYGSDTLYGKRFIFRIPSWGRILDVPLPLDRSRRESQMQFAYTDVRVMRGFSGMPYFDSDGKIVGVAHAMEGHYGVIAIAARVPLMLRGDGAAQPLGDFRILPQKKK